MKDHNLVSWLGLGIMLYSMEVRRTTIFTAYHRPLKLSLTPTVILLMSLSVYIGKTNIGKSRIV